MCGPQALPGGHASLIHAVPQIVNTCGGPDLARSVSSPLLSRDAVGFLRGHLVPKEMSLWESLGETWARPRYRGGGAGWVYWVGQLHGSRLIQDCPPSSEWPQEPQVPPYVPRFHSGWEPPLDVLQEAPWEVEGPAAAPEDQVRSLPDAHLPP